MKEALKLALELIQDYVDDYGPHDKDSGAQYTLTAIKEALAQQCVCGEPNSAGTHRTDGPCLAPQPEQEPVAIHQWRHKKIPNDAWTDDTYEAAYCAPSLFEARTVYTTLPQRTWVGLTDEEELQLAGVMDKSRHWLVAAVEAKLKEKNT